MNVDTGEIRVLQDGLSHHVAVFKEGINFKRYLNGELLPREVMIESEPGECLRCSGQRSVPIPGTRKARRQAVRDGLPVDALYMPCPDCSRIVKIEEGE